MAGTNEPVPTDEQGVPLPVAQAADVATSHAAGTLTNPERAPRRRGDALRGLFLGPVFWRDIRIASRTRATYIMRGTVVLVLFCVLAIAYAAVHAEADSRTSPAQRLQALQVVAPALSITLMWFYFTVFPIMAATGLGGVALERKRGTLSVLAATPMSPASIVLSTMMARLLQVALLFGATLPAVVIVAGYGGMETASVLTGGAIILSTIVLAAACGSFGSVIARTPASAASTGISLLLLVNFYPLLIMMIAALLGAGGAFMTGGWMMSIFMASPFFTLLATDGIGAGGAPFYTPLWLHVAVSLAISGGLLTACVVRWRPIVRGAMAGPPPKVRLSRKARRAAAEAEAKRLAAQIATGSPAPATGVEAGVAAEVPAAADGIVRTASASRTVGDQPVLWRELQQLIPWKSKKSLVISALPFVVLGIIYYNTKPGDEGVVTAVSLFSLAMGVLACCGSASGSISSEVLGRTLPLLLTSRLSVQQILLSKFLGAWLRMWPLAAVTLTSIVVSSLFDGIRIIAVVPILVVFAAATAMMASASLLGAVLFRRPSMSGWFAVLCGLAIWALPFPAVGIVYALLVGMRGRGPMEFFDIFCSFNPFFLMGETASQLERSSRFNVRWPSNAQTGTEVWILILALFVAAATVWTIVALRLARSRFETNVLKRLV
jgi:ABC-type transport system involved in multi-copper enzyme maturation permease subunit